MLRGPAKVLRADFLPAPIFDKPIFCAHEVKIWNHSAGKCFVEPHRIFIWAFRDIPPSRSSGRVSSCDVRSNFTLKHSIANPPLQAATPDGSIVVGSALVVRLKPFGNFAKPVQIRTTADVAA